MNEKKCLVSKYCGGCQYQGIEYKKQLSFKQDYTNKLFKKYGKIKPIIGMSNPLNYRNKVQVSFGYDEKHNLICGNYVTSTHTIVNIDDCMICDEEANKIIQSVKKLIKKYKISIFNENTYKGCIRHLLIRTTNTGQILLVIITGTININKKQQFLNDILKYNPNITSIVQNINNRHTSMVLGSKNIVLYGKGYVYDKLCGLDFRISPSSFYQVNKYQTEKLYSNAIKAASLKKSDIVVDAYCGTGTIGLVCSKKCKEVIGIESNKSAIKDAIINMKNNDINNISFICEDAGKYMSYLSKNKKHIDVVLMDPPRTGADKKFLDNLIKLKPNRIVYISCNPNTLKTNLDYISKTYFVDSIQPVDMFPYTNHIECITYLKLRNNYGH